MLREQIQHKIDNKTKPIGSLGLLEELAIQLALTQERADKIEINKPTVLLFAGDHGIATQGVSSAPPEVTGIMVANFLHQGAAINAFCNSNDVAIKIIDAGTLAKQESVQIIDQRLGSSTKDFSIEEAMSLQTAQQGLQFGAKIAKKTIEDGANIIAMGEMGIGNTSSASAILSALIGISATESVGKGAGISDEKLALKTQLVQRALDLHHEKFTSGEQILACVGGFEIAQMAGAMIESAKYKVNILVDGFIATSAALIACEIEPKTREKMIFCHKSNEKAHEKMLQKLEAKPLLDLEMRLGEGTAAALCVPLLRSCAAFYNNMAELDNLGIALD